MTAQISATRRRFLRTLGGAAAALPFLSVMQGRTRADDHVAPRRFVVLFTGNGTVPGEWFPTGGERDFQLGRILAPLEPFRDRLVVLGSAAEPGRDIRAHIGVSIKSVPDLPSGGHAPGMSSILTGAPSADFGGQLWATHASVDQVIANHIGAETRFPSLELGVRVQGNAGRGKHLCYRGPGLPLPAESDPLAVFDRVFGGLDEDDDARARRAARQARLADFLHARFGAIRPSLGAADRRVLDAHVEALHEVESRLTGDPRASAACVAPAHGVVPPRAAWNDYHNVPQVMRAQLENAVMALACDLTRVVSLQIHEAGTNASHPYLTGPDGAPILDSHHGLSHEPSSNTDAMEKLVRIGAWQSQQVATLLGRLGETPDVDGRTLLDNTLVLWVNELSDGRFHTHQRMPLLLAGGAGGAISTGRYLRVGDEPHSKLLLACVRAMGIDAPSFGPAPYAATEALPGLLA